MERAHLSHIGIQGCLRRARECLYRPNMNSDIEHFINSCKTCSTYNAEQQKETLLSHELTSRPWQKIAFDQQNFLMTVDYYSDYFEIDRINSKKGKEVITKLKVHFARFGLPGELFSDNGPPFHGSEFKHFAASYEFTHSTSLPGYPQSNGEVENAIKTAKRLMRKAKRDGNDPYLALLGWRNTPTEGFDSSPSQRMSGRRSRTLLPTSARLLKPVSSKTVIKSKKVQKAKQQFYYNRNARDKQDFQTGDLSSQESIQKNGQKRKLRTKLT